MWRITTSDDYLPEFTALSQKHRAQAIEVQANAFLYYEALKRLENPQAFECEIVENLDNGLKSIRRNDPTADGIDIRIITYPDFGTQVYSLLKAIKGPTQYADKEYANLISPASQANQPNEP